MSFSTNSARLSDSSFLSINEKSLIELSHFVSTRPSDESLSSNKPSSSSFLLLRFFLELSSSKCLLSGFLPSYKNELTISSGSDSFSSSN
ncbi:hypothetical protein NBO_353g0001 [Nosema bombycis CQ1]|uniref:Uncharacterized protein n=1 Tax=Nosema bombycis (strain CQ1 / CVCC 102059) TaxID=578461 RepID=R0M4F5_NOSB1|nr:hypothetical protein NBO_353g0001 [Nosema bombycis CQ1]|eukprot:EOB12859.1 hypothetical protein NBO_353g0001 [Nosema bombycis CQ1]